MNTTKTVKRVNVYDEDGNYKGWFCVDRSKILAKKSSGDPYVDYDWVYLTASGKLIYNHSNNSGAKDNYYPCTFDRAMRLIIDAGTEDGQAWLNSAKNEENVKKYEI